MLGGEMIDHNNIEETILNTFRKLKSSFIFNVNTLLIMVTVTTGL